MGKAIIPIALGSDFSSSAQMSALCSSYWGWPLGRFRRKLDSFISEQGIASAAKLTTVWSPYLVSGSARIVVGGYDPTAQNEQSRAGDYFSIGTFRAVTRLSCFFSQQFGADFLDELLIAQKTGHEELSRHELIVIGGPKSLHESSLKDCHKNLGVHYDDAQRAYFVGPQRCRVASEEVDGVTKQACVLGFAPNPMNLHKEMLLVSGDSGYGCQGAIEYLVDIRSDLGLVAAEVTQWRKEPRNAPLFFEVSTEFERQSNTYRVGSGVARLIDCTG